MRQSPSDAGTAASSNAAAPRHATPTRIEIAVTLVSSNWNTSSENTSQSAPVTRKTHHSSVVSRSSSGRSARDTLMPVPVGTGGRRG